MDASEKSLPDLVGILKSWFPGRSEPANVSRVFWMPDQSCWKCYDCESRFTLFNRRHHCRLCGLVFCAKCTSNWIPAPSGESSGSLPRDEREKVRACNYCYMQWEQDLAAALDNEIQFVHQDSGSFCSPASFISFSSAGNCDASNNNAASLPNLDRDEEDGVTARGNVDHAATDMGICDQSPNRCVFCTTRSEEEEYDAYELDTERKNLADVNDYYGHIQFDDTHNDFGPGEVHADGEAIDSKSVGSFSVYNSIDSQTSEDAQKIVKTEVEPDISDECETSSSLYAAENVSAEPMDFENNGVIWIPPEPEDEEDEREAILYDDDEDGDAAGECGNLRSSSSFGSGEYRSKDKSNEVHKKVMKNVVDGHFRALIAQLMQVENLPLDEEDESDSWLEIITSLSWEAANLLKPDTSEGGGMDPGGYVKVKCVASGRRSDSMVVKGIVFKKNVAHRRMTSKIEKPRILILGGALEYQRVSNALSSLDTLLQQEMDHLKMAVARIDAHQPDVLLVEKSVSRYAQEYLLAKNISVVLNIKRPLLERIARCTGGQIVPSIDYLSSQKLGHCDMFHVDKFIEEHGTAGQRGKKLVKTLMYFEDCPKPLGCTVLLRGANGDELKKVKHVLQYSVFAAYHLGLETSFLADEGASLPDPLNSPITVGLPDKPSTIERSISTVPGFTAPGTSEKSQEPPPCDPQRSISVLSEDMLKVASLCDQKMETTNFSMLYTAIGTDCIKSSNANQQGVSNLSSNDSFLSYVPVGRSTASSREEPFGAKNVSDWPTDHLTSNGFRPSDALEQGGVSENVPNCNAVETNQSVSNPVLQQESKHVPEEPSSSMEEFPPSPSDNQSILFSLSSRCVWKGTVCEKSHLFRIKYYGNFDKPLGRFLRDHLFDQSYICRSCEMPSEAHVHCYTHRQGTLTISVKKLPEFLLPGEKEGKIWMWHRCLKCPRINGFPPATRRVLMSDAAWGLSFGKFLELSFSNHAAASRVASCGHSLHRDCLRFYGFGKMVACFRYASIDVLSVHLPPSKLDFNYENQDWIQQEVNEVTNRAELLFSEVSNALSNLLEQKSSALLNSGVKVSEARQQMTDLEGMLQKEKAEFEESLQKILNKEAKKGQPVVDIFEINRLRRQLLFQSYMWDHRLVYAASLDNQSRVDADISISDADKSPISNDKYTDCDSPVNPSKDLFNSNQINVTIQGGDVDFDSDPLIGNPSSFSFVMNGNIYDSLESNAAIHRALSDVLPTTAENLSYTLDAAWTGESHSELTRAQSLIHRVPEKLDVEESGEEHSGSKMSHSPLFSTKSLENMEDSMSWLGMPFVSFYRSLNKNFLGGFRKLDTLGEYNPVYISSFRESYVQGGARLLLPIGVNDTVVPVYDDEPASLISYALVSSDYHLQVPDELDKPKESADSTVSMQSLDSQNIMSFQSMDETTLESWKSLGTGDESILSSNGSRNLDPVHARVSFADDGPQGKAKYTVTCYFAKRFEALRRICCPSEMDFVRSLSRCKKWGAQGGKSNVFFAKTLDDRFILKQVTKTELESFIKFAHEYFKYLSESISTGSPTCLAKILGIFQVTSKHLKGGKETKMDILVMENLLFGRNLTRLYDLKGSSRSRYNADCSGRNKVLLDQNLIESMPTCPIFVGNKAKRRLERAVWNDTSFLASVDVMDYSLLVGVDEENHELVLGIIDFMRQYTWDKHLETWVKASGILGGPKNASPTVISPKQYKKRFRKAMSAYFLMIPDQWGPQTVTPSKLQNDQSEDNTHCSATSSQ